MAWVTLENVINSSSVVSAKELNTIADGVQRPMLNLGCGRIILPAPRPAHHALIDAAIYDYPYWHNVDRNQQPGVNQVLDLFQYPWPLESDAYDGALLSHI